MLYFIIISTILNIVIFYLYFKAKKSIYRDDLTTLYNSKRLKEDRRAFKIQDNKHVIFIDIDDLKSINTVFGHAKGSDIIAELGIYLKNSIRETDNIYRYGGDEFIVILKNLEINDVLSIIKRMKEKAPVSISVGMVLDPNGLEAVDRLLEMADDLMYEIKNTTKNDIGYKVIEC